MVLNQSLAYFGGHHHGDKYGIDHLTRADDQPVLAVPLLKQKLSPLAFGGTLIFPRWLNFYVEPRRYDESCHRRHPR